MPFLNITQQGITYPTSLRGSGSPYSPSNLTLNGTTLRACLTFFADRDGVIDAVALRFGSVTTGATITIQFEAITPNTNEPDGSPIAAGASGTHVLQVSDSNTMVVIPLTTPLTISRGDALGLVIYNDVATPGTFILPRTPAWWLGRTPNVISYTTAWQFPATSTGLFGALRFQEDGGSYYRYDNAFFPWESNATKLYDQSNEVGAKFQLPFGCKLNGAWIAVAPNVPDSNARFTLYDADDNALAEFDYPWDQLSTNTGQIIWMPFADLVEVEANVDYRLAARTVAGSFPRGLQSLSYANTDFMTALPWQGQFICTSRTYSGGVPNSGWTDDPLTVIPAWLNVQEIEYSASGSGVYRAKGWSGGFRG